MEASSQKLHWYVDSMMELWGQLNDQSFLWNSLYRRWVTPWLYYHAKCNCPTNHLDPIAKAEILNKQFKSVFTIEPAGDLPNKGPIPTLLCQTLSLLHKMYRQFSKQSNRWGNVSYNVIDTNKEYISGLALGELKTLWIRRNIPWAFH